MDDFVREIKEAEADRILREAEINEKEEDNDADTSRK